MVPFNFDIVTSEMRDKRMNISEQMLFTEPTVFKNVDEHSIVDSNSSDKNTITFWYDEKMDISEEWTYLGETTELKIDESLHKKIDNKVNSNLSNKNEIVLLSDDEEEEESSDLKLTPQNTISVFEEKPSSKSLSSNYREIITHHLKQCSPVKTDEVNDRSKNNLEQNIPINLDEIIIIDRDSHPLEYNSFSLSPDPQVNTSTNEDFQSINRNINIVNFTPNSDTCSINSDQADKPLSDDDNVMLINSEDEDDIQVDNVSSQNSSSIQSLDVSCVSEKSDLENTKYGRFKSQKRRNIEDTDEESQESDTVKEYKEDKEKTQQIDSKGVISTEEDNLELNDEESDLEHNNIEESHLEINDENSEETSLEHHYTGSDEDNEGNSSVYDEQFDEESEESKLEEYHNVGSYEGDEEKRIDIYHVKVPKESEKNKFEHDERSRENNLTVKFYERKTNEEKTKKDKSLNKSDNRNLETFVITLNEKSEEKGTKVNKTLEKTIKEDTVEIIYSEVLKSNRPQNCTSTFDVYNEDCYPIIGYEVNDVSIKNKPTIVINDGELIGSREKNSINEVVGHDVIKNEISNAHHEDMSIFTQEYLSSNTDNYFEMSKKGSSPILDDGFDHLTVAEPKSIKPKASKVNVNLSTPFLFGESYFGSPEISDNKPMLLFGQVYSFENQHLVVDSVENRPDDTQNSSINNRKEMINNKESEEVKLADDIQDIVELESLPESNPDENVDVQKNSKLQLEPQGRICKTHEKNQLSTSLRKSQVTEITKQISQTKLLIETEKLPENKKVTSIETCKQNHTFQMQPVEQFMRADNILQSNLYAQQKTMNYVNETETIKLSNKVMCDETLSPITQNVLHLKTYSKPQKTLKVTSKQDCLNMNVQSKGKSVNTELFAEKHNIFDDGTVLSNTSNTNKTFDSPLQLVKSPITCSKTTSTSHVNLAKSSNFLNNEDMKYIDPVESEDITLQKVDNIILDCVNDKRTNEVIKVYSSESKHLIENILTQANQIREESNTEFIKSFASISRSNNKECGVVEDLLIKSFTDNKSNNILRFSNIGLDDPSVSTNELKLQDNINLKSEPLSGKTDIVHSETQPLLEESYEFNYPCEKNSETIQQIENLSRSTYSMNVTKINKCSDVLDNNTEKNLKHTKLKLSTDYIEENKPSTSKSYTNEQMEDIFNQEKVKDISKNVILPDTEVIMTRSKTKSGRNLIKPETNSQNLFRLSRITEDNHRQVRVSLSKKRSKSQENISITKRRSVRSKSVVDEEKPTDSRRIVFGLEQIPEEQILSGDQIKAKCTSTNTRKSKFNFFSNKSKLLENNSSNFNQQKSKNIKTSRRTKSVQLDPALTLSAVKTRLKRSSSVNLIVSDDKSPTDKDLMGFLQKALVLPKKKRKLSETESIKSIKIQQNVMHIDQNVIESGSDSHGSHQNLIDCSYTSYYEKLSPIPGDNSQHLLLTPKKKKTKLQKVAFTFDEEISSSDESTSSKGIMTRSMNRNTSHAEIEPINLEQKSECQLSVIENVNVSTHVISDNLKPKVSVSRQRRMSSYKTSEAQNSSNISVSYSVNEPDLDNKPLCIKHKNKQLKVSMINNFL